jgi:hypothetical protein
MTHYYSKLFLYLNKILTLSMSMKNDMNNSMLVYE